MNKKELSADQLNEELKAEIDALKNPVFESFLGPYPNEEVEEIEFLEDETQEYADDNEFTNE